MSDTDWRTQAFLILERKLSETPHLSTATNADGDLEIRCSICEQVETYPRVGNRKVDAYTFAMNVTAQHAHKGQPKNARENAPKPGTIDVFLKEHPPERDPEATKAVEDALGDETE